MVLSNITETESGNSTVLAPADNGTIHLPEGVEIATLDLGRDGQNLTLTTPDGQVFVVEGYFLAPDAPAILSAGGAMLSPALVQSFMNAGDVDVAANASASDASPVGHVTEVSGNATVTHADGSREKITSGAAIFEGDIVETDAQGAVNITFIDESTFAVSKNARLAVDDFSFNPSDQSGTTGLSVLRGVFMFTSGLIGRENPDAVHLETPVGSIGIRGTIIGGEISETGHSQISVLEGAIVVRNGTGEQILSNQFATVQLTGFNNPIQNIGILPAQSISHDYGAVRNVSPTLFTSIDDVARETPNNQQPQQQPEQQQAQPTQPTDDTRQNQPPVQNQAPQANAPETAPPPAPTPPAVDAPVIFQTLNTGSGQNNPLGAPQIQQPSAPPVPPPAPPAANVAPPPPPPPPAEAQAPQPAQPDTRPPAAAVFVAGGQVNEEAPAGTIVGTVHMAETRGYTVTYSLASNPDGRFAIDAATGVVTLAIAAGDTEAGATHHDFSVRIERNAGIFSDTPLTVPVLAVDEAPRFDATGSAINIDEGAALVLTTAMVNATDPESAPVTYTITGQTKGALTYDNGSTVTTLNPNDTFTHADLAAGYIKFVHDGSEPGGAGFTLTASDATAHTSPAKTFTIDVTNVNDAPVQTASSGGTILENSTTIIDNTMLHYTDSDAGDTPDQIVYTLTGLPAHGTVQFYNGASWVTLGTNATFTQDDVNTGKLRFTQNGDENPSDTLSYTVSDGETTSGTQIFSYTVTNVNDTPVLVHHTTGGTIDEDTALVLTSSMLQYSDAEQGAASLTYTVTSEQHGNIQVFSGSWNNATSFTQDDVDSGHVRFLQNGDENTNASFDFELTDGIIATPLTGTFTIAINGVNDPVTSIAINSSTSFDERPAAASAPIDLGALSINDAEPMGNLSPGDFTIRHWDGSGYVTDATSAKFSVYLDSGVWKLQADAGTAFNYETDPTIKLKISLTDGGATVTSNELVITVNDTNDTATALTLNNDIQFKSSVADGFIQGHVNGGYIGVIDSIDEDQNASFRPDVTDYSITGFTQTTGSTLTISDFEIVSLTHDGKTDIMLKIKDGVTPDFSLTEETYTITITLDAAQDDPAASADNISRTFTLTGRDDTMLLESVNGTTGFEITNNARFGGVHFGASVAVGDFNGDGRIDLVFGAPQALNGETPNERSGGIYAFSNNAAFATNALDGTVNLSANTGGGNGFFRELSTGSDDSDHFYGASLAALRNFDGNGGADIAVSNFGDNSIDIIHNGNTGTITSVINLDTGSPTTNTQKQNAIKVTSIGDINGDGLTDMLVSTQYSSGNAGSAYVITGGTHGTTIDASNLASDGFSITATTAGTNAFFGAAIAGLGDFDGDGLKDFAISSTGVDTNGVTTGSSQGQVTLYFGDTSAGSSYYAGTSSRLVINGVTDAASIGDQIASAGDFNGDGQSELLIRSSGIANGGAVYMIFGNANLAGETVNLGEFGQNAAAAGLAGYQGFKIYSSTNTGTTIGNSIGSAGDFNGDGYDDIFVDLSRDLGGGNYEHTLAIIYGKAGATNSFANIDLASALNDPAQSYKIRLLDPTTSDHLAVTGAGDLNGDGYQDLVIGNGGQSDSNGASGGAYVVYGNNYDEKAVEFDGFSTATTAGQSFVGGTGDDSLSSNSKGSLSFLGGDGNDTFVISNQNDVRNFDGGLGTDTLKLFFSSGETAQGLVDSVNLQGISKNMQGVEQITFQTGSLQDILTLDIHDILSLAATNGTGQIRINASESVVSGGENYLSIYNSASSVSDLHGLTGNLQFTNDADSNSTADTVVDGGISYHKYTNISTGLELLVDDRLGNAATLATG